MPFERINEQLKEFVEANMSTNELPLLIGISNQLQLCYLKEFTEDILSDYSVGKKYVMFLTLKFNQFTQKLLAYQCKKIDSVKVLGNPFSTIIKKKFQMFFFILEKTLY